MQQLDEALQRLGWNGKYHVTLFVILGAITLRDPWPLFGIVFIGQEIAHQCRLPENVTLNYTVPPKLCSDTCGCDLDRCHLALNGSADALLVPCPDGWQYGTPLVSKFHYELDYETSVVTEWDLVCDRSYLVDLSTTIFVAGVLVGSLLSQLSDRFGRKQALLLSLWLQGAVAAATALTTDFTQFAVARFAVGAINQVSVLVGFVYVVELYPASSRTKPAMFMQIFWGVGVALMAPIAYLFKNWRLFQLAVGLPAVLFIPLYWFMPESVFWLVNAGRVAEAEAVLQRAAKMNGVTLPANCLSRRSAGGGGGRSAAADEESKELQTVLLSSEEASPIYERGGGGGGDGGGDSRLFRPSDGEACGSPQAPSCARPEPHTFVDLFRSSVMRRYTLVLFGIWFITSLNYLSLSLSTSQLYGNKYVNFFIGGIIEIPACIIAALLANRFGRRKPILALSTLVGACGIVLFFLPASLSDDCQDTRMEIVRSCLAMVGKFCITGSYAILVLLTPEIFPTSIRNLGFGLCSVCDNLGGMSSPLINMISQSNPGLPRVLIGVLALVAGLGVLLLPETHGRSLPDEVKDVETWAKGQQTVCNCLSAATEVQAKVTGDTSSALRKCRL